MEKIIKMLYSSDNEMVKLGLVILVEKYPDTWKTYLEDEYSYKPMQGIFVIANHVIVKYLNGNFYVLEEARGQYYKNHGYVKPEYL